MNSQPTPPVFFSGRVAVVLFSLLAALPGGIAADGDAATEALGVAEADRLIRAALAQPDAPREYSPELDARRRAARQRGSRLWTQISTTFGRASELMAAPASPGRDEELDRLAAQFDAFSADPLHWDMDLDRLRSWAQVFGSRLVLPMLVSAEIHLARGRPESALLRLDWAIRCGFNQINIYSANPGMAELLKNTPGGREVLGRARQSYLARFNPERVRDAQRDYQAAVGLALDYHSPEAFLTAARLAQNVRRNAAGNDALLLSCVVLDRIMHLRRDPGYRLLWGDDWVEKFDAALRADPMLRRLRGTKWMQSHLERKEDEVLGLCSDTVTQLFAARLVGRSRHQMLPPDVDLADFMQSVVSEEIGLRWNNPRPADAAAGAGDAQKFLSAQALALILPEVFLTLPFSSPALGKALKNDPAGISQTKTLYAALVANIEARDETPDEAFSKTAAALPFFATEKRVFDFDITLFLDGLARESPVLLPFACYQLALLGEQSDNPKWTRIAVDYLFSPAD